MKDKYYHDTRGYYFNKYPEDEKARLEKAVDKFAYKMKKKLIKKFEEGYRGWDSKENKEIIANKLQDNCVTALEEFDKNGLTDKAKKEFIDIANLAMMLTRFCDYNN